MVSRMIDTVIGFSCSGRLKVSVAMAPSTS
jgi:hypothetical protein